jgi:hypothetical protein
MKRGGSLSFTHDMEMPAMHFPTRRPHRRRKGYRGISTSATVEVSKIAAISISHSRRSKPSIRVSGESCADMMRLLENSPSFLFRSRSSKWSENNYCFKIMAFLEELYMGGKNAQVDRHCFCPGSCRIGAGHAARAASAG